MKTKLWCLPAAGLALLIGSVTVQAQYQWQNQNTPYYPESRFYMNADVGGSLLQNVDIENLGARVGFNAGTRVDFSFGCNIVKQFAVEFETGVIWNSMHGSDAMIISPAADNADLFQVPLLVNLVFKAPLKCGLTPYIGGGAGGVISTLQLSNGSSDFFDNSISDTDFTFAYQGFAGLKYAVAWNLEVGVGYKFLGTLDHRWFGDDPNLYIHTTPTYSHSILATFTWRF